MEVPVCNLLIRDFRLSARSYEWTIAAPETGVKRQADIVWLQEPPRGRGGVGISHLAYEM